MSNKDLKYKNKYLKYKNKYLDLQSQIGGSPPSPSPLSLQEVPVMNSTNYMNLPEEIQRLLILYQDKESLKDVDKASTAIVNKDILESLKKKLKLNKSYAEQYMFILDPIYVYHPEYLSNEEILKLVKIFINNIRRITEPHIQYNVTPNSFNLQNLKEFILDPGSLQEFVFDNNYYVSDNQLHFELLFIFYCILFKQINFPPQLEIKFIRINFVSFTRSFWSIIFGLYRNIIKMLTFFDITNTEITDNEVILLTNALAVNTTLLTLEFRSVGFTDAGFQALVNALLVNTTLTTLVLSFNQIGDDVANVLANALKENTTLTTLKLSGNNIGDEGGKALLAALETNTTLRTLELDNNDCSDEIKIDIKNKLAINAKIP